VRREEALAVGDSATDAALAPLVAAVFIVANGGPVLQGRAVGDNVYLTEEAYGDGFAEAALALVKG
jgi:hydroxymethylpyrimidine pyrophosphatase-like HAD family hydrolase